MILKIKKKQTHNEKLVSVRRVFDEYNLISAVHSYLSIKDEKFKNLLPPLVLLDSKNKTELTTKLNKLKFVINDNLAA